MTDLAKRMRDEHGLGGRPISKGRLLIEGAERIEALEAILRRIEAAAKEAREAKPDTRAPR